LAGAAVLLAAVLLGAAGAVASARRVAVAAIADVAAVTAATSADGSGRVVLVVESDDTERLSSWGKTVTG